MKKNMKPRELEMLSAYLDGQLTTREQSRISSRLRSSPELLAALEDLRRTRAVLRSLPSVQAPRNFILTEKMVGQKEPTINLFSSFRFASVMASILLVLVVVGDFMGVGRAVPTWEQKSAPAMIEVARDETDIYKEAEGANENEAPGPVPESLSIVATVVVEKEVIEVSEAEVIESAVEETLPEIASEPASDVAEGTDLEPPTMVESQPEFTAEGGEVAGATPRTAHSEQPLDDTAVILPVTVEVSQLLSDQIATTPTIEVGALSQSLPEPTLVPGELTLPEEEDIHTLRIDEEEVIAEPFQVREDETEVADDGDWDNIRIVEGILGFVALSTGVYAYLIRKRGAL